MNINFDELMTQEIKNLKHKPSLLLHICCAPCSSGVLDRLIKHFNVTALFYNPNISEKEEYEKRKEEFLKFNKTAKYNISIIDCEHSPSDFLKISEGLEKEPEGGKRCEKCFELRLTKTAQIAKKYTFEYFTTTLSVSPYKNSTLLNNLGKNIGEKFGVKYLISDFKKKNGYLNSIINSEKYSLYRQDYCGCIYSKLERETYKNNKINKN